jgi:hypothetical protein
MVNTQEIRYLSTATFLPKRIRSENASGGSLHGRAVTIICRNGNCSSNCGALRSWHSAPSRLWPSSTRNMIRVNSNILFGVGITVNAAKPVKSMGATTVNRGMIISPQKRNTRLFRGTWDAFFGDIAVGLTDAHKRRKTFLAKCCQSGLRTGPESATLKKVPRGVTSSRGLVITLYL